MKVGLRKLYPEDSIPEKKEDTLLNKADNNQIDLNIKFYEGIKNGVIDFSLFDNDGDWLKDCFGEMQEALKFDEPTKIYYHYAYMGEYLPGKGFTTRYSTAHYDFSQAWDLQDTLTVLAQIVEKSAIKIKEAV